MKQGPDKPRPVMRAPTVLLKLIKIIKVNNLRLFAAALKLNDTGPINS